MKFLQSTLMIHLLVLLFTAAEGDIYSQDRFTADEEVSRIWIEGSSNVNTFDCIAHEYNGKAAVHQTISNTPEEQPLFLKLKIEVDGFDCGKQRMNRDLKNALKADSYPEIIFTYNRADPIETENSEQSNTFLVQGSLTVAGVTRDISFIAEGDLLGNGKMRARGSKKILMTDYDIKPPTGLFGLIKADDELTVHFDLIAKRI